MNRVYFVETAGGTRRLDEQDFPLSVGGSGADIAVEGIADNTVLAQIALSGGHAYIQPADETVELFHNHEHLNTSTWLKSGDRVQLGDQVLSWRVKGDQVFVNLRQATHEPELLPPVVSPPEAFADAGAGPVPIARPATSPQSRRRLRQLFIASFSLLALTALFVLLATPMAVTISPEPDSWSLRGFPPPVPVGGRMLVVPGSYTLVATRDGYYPLQQALDVPSGGFQAFAFDLQELPGRVRFIVDPDVPVRVIADDTALRVNPENIALLERGARHVRIETDRYLPEQRELEVIGRGTLQELKIQLRPAWAYVKLESEPTGATVKLDGEVIGTTPFSTEVIQGQRGLEFSLAGFKTFHLERFIEAGTSPVLDPIRLQANDGTLILESLPAGATVSEAGMFHGSTPLTLVLTSGVTHRLRLGKPGYLATEQSVKLAADENRQLSVVLPPEYGIVFVTSQPADADLTVDDKPAGGGTQRLRLTTREHVLTFSKPGYLPQTVNVMPRADTSQDVDVTLRTRAQAKADARPAVVRTATGLDMRLLEPVGAFQMGASRREAGRRANESQRLVELTKPFYLSANEVSNAAYRRFNANHNSGSAEGVSLNADDHPVVNVSWGDAARFCNWLSQLDNLAPAYEEQDGHMVLLPTTGAGYRLPTEAEWVYAARIAGQTRPARYPWSGGYPPSSPAGNFADAQIADTLADVVSGYNDGYRGPAPVGSFPAQPPGFHDLGGNVAEWINDYYAVYPGQAETRVRDPGGPASGDHHVVRGSSWRDGSITELRLSYRDYSRGPRDDLGFRIARYADE